MIHDYGQVFSEFLAYLRMILRFMVFTHACVGKISRRINYRSVALGNGKTLILCLNGTGSEWLDKRVSVNKAKHLSIMLRSCRMTLSSPCWWTRSYIQSSPVEDCINCISVKRLSTIALSRRCYSVRSTWYIISALSSVFENVIDKQLIKRQVQIYNGTEKQEK